MGKLKSNLLLFVLAFGEEGGQPLPYHRQLPYRWAAEGRVLALPGGPLVTLQNDGTQPGSGAFLHR